MLHVCHDSNINSESAGANSDLIDDMGGDWLEMCQKRMSVLLMADSVQPVIGFYPQPLHVCTDSPEIYRN